MILFNQRKDWPTPDVVRQHIMDVLRPYQRTSFLKIMAEFASGLDSTLLILPTGCGKTVTFAQVARYCIALGSRVLVMAHREELIHQAVNTMAGFGVDAAIEKAENRARDWGDPACVVASVQTMQGKRLASWNPGHFGLVITDEAHHATSDSYRRVFDHLQPTWHLGVTATADRMDRTNLGEVFRSVAFEYSMREAIDSGYLARLRFVRCETSVDLSNIRTTAGDLKQDEIEEAIRPHIEELANVTAREIGDRRTIVFCPDVGSAQAFASALNHLDIKAASIAGDSADRADILRAFKSGAFRVLCNCNLLTEGFDAPFVQAVVLCRPTKSRSLYCQMVGRGTRIAPNKENCLIVDFAWLTGKHKLVSPVELFRKSSDVPTDDDQADAAEVAIKLEQGQLDLMDAIEQAREERAERRRLKVEAKKREVQYTRVSYDPFGNLEQLGFPTKPESDAALRFRPTDKQIAMLERAGIPDVDKMSRHRASQMIQQIIDRREKGLATLKQVNILVKNGFSPIEAGAMKFESAKLQLDRVFAGRSA